MVSLFTYQNMQPQMHCFLRMNSLSLLKRMLNPAQQHYTNEKNVTGRDFAFGWVHLFLKLQNLSSKTTQSRALEQEMLQENSSVPSRVIYQQQILLQILSLLVRSVFFFLCCHKPFFHLFPLLLWVLLQASAIKLHPLALQSSMSPGAASSICNQTPIIFALHSSTSLSQLRH